MIGIGRVDGFATVFSQGTFFLSSGEIQGWKQGGVCTGMACFPTLFVTCSKRPLAKDRPKYWKLSRWFLSPDLRRDRALRLPPTVVHHTKVASSSHARLGCSESIPVYSWSSSLSAVREFSPVQADIPKPP